MNIQAQPDDTDRPGELINPKLLQVHSAVMRYGTLTAAADELGYTVSAVSQQLAALEREVGQPLWEKSGRKVRPTEAGLLLGERSEEILAPMRQIRTALDDLRLGRKGRLRVVSFHTAGESLLPAAIADLQTTLPGVVVQPMVDETEGALRRLRAGEVEVVIVVEPFGRGEEPQDDLQRIHLMDDPYRLLLPAGHRLSRRRQVEGRELADEDWITTAGPFDYVVIATNEFCRRSGFSPRVVAEADEFPTMQGYVAVGLGIGIAPALALDAVRRNVIVRRLRKPPEPRHIWMTTRPATASHPPVRALTSALRSAARSRISGT